MPTRSRRRSPTSWPLVAQETAGLGCELTFEPGRRLVGEAGVLVSEVILVKPGAAKTFVIVDAAMNDLIRPTLYEAWHDILPVRERAPMPPRSAVTLSGRSANRATIWHRDRDLAPLAAGDLDHDTLGGRLWGGHGLDLQYPAPGAGGHGRWHAICGHPAKALDRRVALRRAVSALDGAGKALKRKRKDGDGRQPDHHRSRRPVSSRKIGLAWLALAWEGLWPRLVPVLSFVALFIAAAHLDLFAGLDPWVHTGILAALALALDRARPGGGCAISRWPAQEAAIRRLERDSGVPHRPLVAVQDTLAAGEPPIRCRRPCGRPIAAARPSGWPASATGPPIPASPCSTPGRCASCRCSR